MCRLLGTYRDEAPAYASTLALDSLHEDENLALQCVGKSYPVI